MAYLNAECFWRIYYKTNHTTITIIIVMMIIITIHKHRWWITSLGRSKFCNQPLNNYWALWLCARQSVKRAKTGEQERSFRLYITSMNDLTIRSDPQALPPDDVMRETNESLSDEACTYIDLAYLDLGWLSFISRGRTTLLPPRSI